ARGWKRRHVRSTGPECDLPRAWTLRRRASLHAPQRVVDPERGNGWKAASRCPAALGIEQSDEDEHATKRRKILRCFAKLEARWRYDYLCVSASLRSGFPCPLELHHLMATRQAAGGLEWQPDHWVCAAAVAESSRHASSSH